MLGKLQLSKPTPARPGFHPTPCCTFPSPGEGSHPAAEAVVEAAGTKELCYGRIPCHQLEVSK